MAAERPDFLHRLAALYLIAGRAMQEAQMEHDEYEYRTGEALELALPRLGPLPIQFGDDNDPTGVRPLIDRVLSGDWHATGRRKAGDGKLPLKREVIRPEFWEFLQVDVIADSASGDRYR